MENLVDHGVGAMEPPLKKQKLHEGPVEDVGPVGDSVVKQIDVKGDQHAAAPSSEAPAVDSAARSSVDNDRSGLAYDEQGYPLLTDAWAGVKREYLLSRTAVQVRKPQFFIQLSNSNAK